MPIRFIHTADIHLGKTYRNSPGENERYNDLFLMLSGIVAEAIRERVDFVLIAGDLFHTGQILPRTFARTIEILQPLKSAGIPCIAVEGNHDWIHRRESISWMEALSQMGYISLLRPSRTDIGGYCFDPFDKENGCGGRLEINGINIYGLGYIGAQAGAHVPRICEAVTTRNNILLFHVGIWTYSPVEIGNMTPEEAQPLAEVFDYVALGHGHKPYIVQTPEGHAYAFNPGSPERVNFGEERYDKGYYLVTLDGRSVHHQFFPTTPRPMISLTVNCDGAEDVDSALALVREHAEKRGVYKGSQSPLVELKLAGRVKFHPFELDRDRLRLALKEALVPLHLEIRNQLSLAAAGSGGDSIHRSLLEIEREVLSELICANSSYKGREDEIVRLSLAIRDLVLREDEVGGEELFALLSRG